MKGTMRIVIGVILIALQLMSLAGNAKAGVGIQISFDSLAVLMYDLIVAASYCFVGIVGAVLLISGIIAHNKGDSMRHHPEEDAGDTVNINECTDDPKGFTIPLSTIMPILVAIFVVLLIVVVILERN